MLKFWMIPARASMELNRKLFLELRLRSKSSVHQTRISELAEKCISGGLGRVSLGWDVFFCRLQSGSRVSLCFWLPTENSVCPTACVPQLQRWGWDNQRLVAQATLPPHLHVYVKPLCSDMQKFLAELDSIIHSKSSQSMSKLCPPLSG